MKSITVEVQGKHPTTLEKRAVKLAAQFFGYKEPTGFQWPMPFVIHDYNATPAYSTRHEDGDLEVQLWEATITVELPAA